MLALTRKKGESIMVGNEVEVIVLGIQGDQVKLGFVAPKNVTIHRKEIYEQIQAENREALNASIKTNKKIDLSALNQSTLRQLSKKQQGE